MGSANRNGTGPDIGVLLRPLRETEAFYRLLDTAQAELTRSIGVPICVDGCGKCCETVTPVVGMSEAQFAASYIIGSPEAERVLSVCEGWLLDSGLTRFGYTGMLNQTQWDKVRPDVDLLLGAGTKFLPCPFLTPEKTCLVHEIRPLACRTYGVTRMAARMCPRPLSRYETDDARAHIAESSPLGQKLWQMMRGVQRHSSQAGMMRCMFLPTAIYRAMRPAKYLEYFSRIATAKTVVMAQNPSILFQSQLNQVWQQETAKETANVGS